METMETIMKLSINNLGKPADPKYKKIADIALYLLLAEIPIVATLPVSDTVKFWITLGLTQGTIAIKAITKFTLDPNYVDDNNQDYTEVN